MKNLTIAYTVEFDTGRELDAYVQMINLQKETVNYYVNVTDNDKFKITVRVEL